MRMPIRLRCPTDRLLRDVPDPGGVMLPGCPGARQEVRFSASAQGTRWSITVAVKAPVRRLRIARVENAPRNPGVACQTLQIPGSTALHPGYTLLS